MKAVIDESKCCVQTPTSAFPAIYRSFISHNVLLFTDRHCGVVLECPAGRFEVGNYADDWERCDNAEIWERMPDKYTVTLSNG